MLLAFSVPLASLPVACMAPKGDTAADLGGDSGSVDAAAPGVLRLGPPSPTVGIFGVAAHPDADFVYVSNLHVPWITLVDKETGAWAGSLDLRDVGQDEAYFPFLYIDGRNIWATNWAEGTIGGFALADHAPLDPIVLPADPGEGATEHAGSLWVSLADGRLVEYRDGEEISTVEVGASPGILAVTDDRIAVLHEGRVVTLYDRKGTALWSRALRETRVEAIAIIGSSVYVADRASGDVLRIEEGEELGRVHTGSDTFGLFVHDGRLLVTNRQGAELPESGTFEGAPGLVTALQPDLSVDWTLSLATTVHFLSWDGQAMWTANEDDLVMSRVDVDQGVELLRGPHIGLTLDVLSEHDGRIWAGSHLTDQIWAADFDSASAASVDVCSWPFQALFTDAGEAWTVCQEEGALVRFDPDAMVELERVTLDHGLHRPCVDGLCIGHSLLAWVADDHGDVAWTSPYDVSVHWRDGTTVALEPETVDTIGLQHMGMVAVDDALFAWNPLDSSVSRIVDSTVLDRVVVEGSPKGVPLVADGSRTWAGKQAFSADLAEVARLPHDRTVVAAGAGVVVGLDDDSLATYDADSLELLARLDLDRLRVVPGTVKGGETTPQRFIVTSDGELIVGDLFKGTLERRSLPDLGPLGDDEIVSVGDWAELPGLEQ